MIFHSFITYHFADADSDDIFSSTEPFWSFMERKGTITVAVAEE